MATNLLNMVGQGEKAFGFLTGDMDSGFDVTVGFFNDIARYVAFKKRSGRKWEESDLRSVLMQIGPFSNWSSKPGSDRSEEHTSELQSHSELVCRLLLEKKKTIR